MKRVAFAIVLAAAVLSSAFSNQWLQTETDNFTFIYQPDEARAVEELVSYAEEIYESLTALLGTTTPRVTVVLYGETDFANGYYNPSPPQHIGLYTVQPSGPWIGAGTESWLRYLFIHELTHFIQANHRPSLFYGLGSIFGPSISGLDIGFVPLWVTEGIAIHTESIFTGGGRQNDPLFELYYKAPAIEGEFFSLWQAGYSSHLAPQGNRPYVAGAFIWRELEERYGPQFASQFLDAYSPFPLFGMWRAIRETTGNRMTTIYESTTSELIERYAEESKREVDAQITPDVGGHYALPAETDRGLITYRFRPDKRSGFVLIDDATRTEHELFATISSDRDSWDVTGDGSLIVFATPTSEARSAVGSTTTSDLFLFDSEEATTQRLTSTGGFFSPAVDEAGRYVVAAQRTGNYHRLVWFELGSPLSEPKILLEAPESRFYYPDISPDGRVALAAINQEGRQQIILTTGPSHPTPGQVLGYVPLVDGAAPYKPVFDGNSAVTFSAHVEGTLALFRYEFSTGVITRIATDRVGIVGGFTNGADVVYQAYTSDGFVVRRGQSLEQAIVPERYSDLPFTFEGSATVPRVSITGTPYRALPKPRFWLPWLAIREPASGDFNIGVGAVVVGSDYLGRNAWQSELFYFPAYRRPGYGFSYTWSGDRSRAQLALREEYLGNVQNSNSPLYVQRFDNTLRFDLDLLSGYALGVSNTLTLGLTLEHIAALEADESFALWESLGDKTVLGAGLLAPGTALSYSRVPQAPLNAAVAPGAFGASGQIIAPFALPELHEQGLLLGAGGFANLAVGGSHVIRVEPVSRFATNERFGRPFALRGFSSGVPASDGSAGYYRVAIDYLPPRFLVDLPLSSSLGITEIGFGTFAETVGDIATAPVALIPLPQVAIGLEATVVVTYLLDWPLTFGVSLRLQGDDPASFSSDDLSFYVDIDLIESIGTIGDYIDN